MAYNPWRVLRHLAGWTLEHVTTLPKGRWGETVFEERKILLAKGINQHERRSTLAHELEHVARGEVPDQYRPREEATVNRIAARKLLPDIKAIGDELAWARSIDEAAFELWVDPETLTTRLATLHPAERAYLIRRLAWKEN